jgi:excisionase family DNA binding protein
MTGTMTPAEPRYLDTADVAALFSVTRTSISRWVRNGRLPAARAANGQFRFAESDVLALVEGHVPAGKPVPAEVVHVPETLPVPGTSETFAARVFSYIDFFGDCWEWTGTDDGHGYGVIGRGRRNSGLMAAHRAVWELLVGPIADGLQIDHLCRNHMCVNPDHLEPVTAEENKRRGFSMARLHAARDTCRFGHPKDGITQPKNGKPHRYCKTCRRRTPPAERANERSAA